MKHEVQYPGYCKHCSRAVSLKEATLGREQLNPGAEHIFHICPYCNIELEDEVVCIEN